MVKKAIQNNRNAAPALHFSRSGKRIEQVAAAAAGKAGF